MLILGLLILRMCRLVWQFMIRLCRRVIVILFGWMCRLADGLRIIDVGRRLRVLLMLIVMYGKFGLIRRVRNVMLRRLVLLVGLGIVMVRLGILVIRCRRRVICLRLLCGTWRYVGLVNGRCA